MLNWLNDTTDDAGIAVIDCSQGPRTLAQFRALLALSVGGVSREELDTLAGVSNSPALIQGLDALGFRVGSTRRRRPGALIWSADRSELKAGRHQYALTELGEKVFDELMQLHREFRHPVFGYNSYLHALVRHELMFAHAPQVMMALLVRNGYEKASGDAA